ncbi:MAG: magnesium transporter [Acidimicrobiia bacterium]|nr:magnesium transporter [Acidimicrobiia bacterium]
MRLRLRRPRDLAVALRELARRRPREAEEYLEDHAEEWESVAEADPATAADILEAVGQEATVELLADLDPEEASEVVAEMRLDAAAEALTESPPEFSARVVEAMSAAEAADVIGAMDAADQPRVLEHVADGATDDILALLAYPPDSAGGLMTTEFAAIQIGLTAGEAIEALRRLQEEVGQLAYVYITDHDQRLHGVLSFRDLVFSRPGTGIDEAMVSNPVAVRPETDREEVAELIQRYGLLSLPVVDFRGRLLGIVTVDEILEAVQEEAVEDIVVMVGAGVGETVHTTVARSVRNRFPWIVVNLAIAFAVAAVVSRFEPVISRTAILAAYMPVVAAVGGNGGAQSLAIVIRALATSDLPEHRSLRVVGNQALIGAINGLAVAAAASIIAFVFTDSAEIALIIGVAAFANMIAAGAAGAAIPMLLQRYGQDPALASNIFLTLVTDIVGFGGFLAIATLLL